MLDSGVTPREANGVLLGCKPVISHQESPMTVFLSLPIADNYEV